MHDLQRIAVVIDADNTQFSKIESVLQEVSKRGRIVVKRAYGNWKKDNLKNWESEIKRLAIKAIQQFDYVPKKNATDMALVIDTMDLLHGNTYDAFVIVSSDSDYTPLAIRLRESGVSVIGVGEKKTPTSFKNACDEFLLLENLAESTSNVPSQKPSPVENNLALREDIQPIHELLRAAYETYQDNDGFANLAPVGAFLKRTKPDFDCRTYGYTKLPQLLEDFPQKYEVKRYPGKGTVTIVAYRCID